MQIDFIIQWKNRVKNKSDLTHPVNEMLTGLFTDVTDESFSYILDDNSSYFLKYNFSEKDNKAYLQIISNESEARAALSLSNIRDNITKGEHRKDFLIICSYDEASLSYCCKLMEPMGMFERHLRQLMYLITTNAFGVDWANKTFPPEIINGIKERTQGSLSEEKITESAFEFLDYGEITTYLFSERYLELSPEQLIEEKLSDQALNDLSKEEIISAIVSHRKKALWDKLFSNINGINEETIKKISKYRNDVMHHHTLNNSRFKDIRKEVQAADKILTKAIIDIENKIYTEEESKILYSSIGYALAEMMKSINIVTKLNSYDMTSYISSTLIKLGNIINEYYKNIDISNTISIALSQIPDYLKLIEMSTSSYMPENDSIQKEDVYKADEKKDSISLNGNKTTDEEDDDN